MVTQTCDLLERLKTIPDHRRQCRNLKHRLEDILLLGFCGTLAGCDDCVEIADWAADNAAFFRTFLGLPHGIPSHDTLNRTSRAVKPPPCRRWCCPGCWNGVDYRATGYIPTARPCVIPAGTQPG